ncbi:MAG: hypothetical protein HZA67_05165 [Rhodospirillales bacterium]|jgi:hypothetical protein|nr:hypothetical protein [Rhodospirillales bacterium]
MDQLLAYWPGSELFANGVIFLHLLGAVTRSLSSNRQSASAAATSISQNISEISAAVQQAAGAVVKTKEAAQVLAR